MSLKVLILFFAVFILSKAEDDVIHPEFTIDQTLMNIGPSMIRSVKGKFYEETQKEVIAKPVNDDVPLSKNKTNIASQSHNILPTRNNMPNQGEKILYRRRKLSNNTIERIPQINNRQNALKNYDLENFQTQANNTDLSMIFQNGKIVSNYDINKTIETTKKGLFFDSILVKNDYKNSMSHTNKAHEINTEEDIVHKPIKSQVGQPYRRYETYPDFEPIPPINFPMPEKDDNNLRPFDNQYNIPNYTNMVIPGPSQQNNKPITSEKYLSILSEFGPRNNDNNVKTTTTDRLKQNNYNVIDTSKSACDEKESDEFLDRMGNDVQFKEPTKGVGISSVGKSRVMLMDHPRVCYACSSITDPTCWSPHRTTTVKYCRTDHPACLTKLYKYRGVSYIIRDCGDTCELDVSSEGPTTYASCTICHNDLCNSANRFNIQIVTVLMLLIFHLLFIFNFSVR